MNTQTTIEQVQTQTNNQLNIKQTLTSFSNHLQQSGKSQKTIESYITDVKEYLTFNNSTNITRDSIANYKNYILNTKKNSSTTHNRKISSLKAFNEFLIADKKLDTLLIIEKDFVKIQTSTLSPTTITEKQVLSFIEKIHTKESFRNYVIVNILTYAGLRIFECLKIKISDINFKAQELLVIGKGNKERTVILNDKLISLIQEYINTHRPKTSEEYLFISQKGGKLDESTINRIFNTYSKTITPHKLRHFYCTNVLTKGILNIYETAQQVGHSSINTTQRYTHPNKESIKNKLNRM